MPLNATLAPARWSEWLRGSLAGIAAASLVIPTALWITTTFFNLGVSELPFLFLLPAFSLAASEPNVELTGRGIPFFIGPVYGILVFILALVVLLRTARVHRRGYLVSIAVLSIGGSMLLYLVLDCGRVAPPEGRLWHLREGVRRAPKSLVLQCSKDAEFGRIQTWPKVELTYPENETSREWITGHRDEILSDWEKSAPIRSWVAEMNGYEGLDDYADSVESLVLDLNALRQCTQTIRRHALLLAYDGQSEKAVLEARDLLLFGQKLKDGSRNYVSFMMGIVVEKIGLRLLLCISRDGGAKLTRSELVGLDLNRDQEDWDGFARVIRSDGQSFIAVAKRTYAKGVEPFWSMGWFLWNQNCLTATYQARIETLAMAASRRDLSVFGSTAEPPPFGELPRTLHFKNWEGNILVDQMMPTGSRKICASLGEARRLRGEVKAILK